MRTALADHLPACLVEDGTSPGLEPFMRRFLSVFDELAARMEDQVGGLEHLVDPSVAPLPMVRWLGSWLAIDLLDPETPERLQREWVGRMGELLWWRGTRKGVAGILELVSGKAVEITDGGGVVRRGETTSAPGRVAVWVEDGGAADDRDLLALLRTELPAEVAFELRVGERVVWPRDPTARR